MNETKHAVEVGIEKEGGYIVIAFHGDLIRDTVEEFKQELDFASGVVEKYYKDTGAKVHILLDMSDFSGNYALDALSALVAFARHNKPFVERTASFGGSDKVIMAGEVAIALSGRDNIKLFKRRDDALAWLLDPQKA
jgi:hypothetical protein